MNNSEIHAELIIDAKAELGEGPHWDNESNKLYWVDITGKSVRIYDQITGSEDVRSYDLMVSAVIPTTAGGLLLAMEDGVYISDSGVSPVLLTPVEADLLRNRSNDAKCDRQGRLWLGTMSMDDEAKAGGLYVLEPGGSCRQVLSEVGISNGLAWDYEHSKMYYIDTPTGQVDVFDYDEVSGNISNRRVAFKFPESAGHPDGMTIDSEGMLWVAHWGGGCVSRWDPNTGEQIGRIQVPAPQVTSCTFGGSNLTELYITTARSGLSEEDLSRYPHAGGLFMAKPGVSGVLSSNYHVK